MVLQLFVWIFLGGFCMVDTLGNLGPEGCPMNWDYYDDFCYLAVSAHMHFDSAKAVCMIKEATLTSLWGQKEITFVAKLLHNLNIIQPFSWVGTSVSRNNMWVWLDGSGNIDAAFQEMQDATKDLCGGLTTGGALELVDCDVTMPAFVCKKPLDMVYIPNNANISQDGIYLLDRDPDETIFERLLPPYLDQITLNLTSPSHIITVEVAHETDCAYRCYTVDDCQAFAVACKSARKCNVRLCRLLSGLDKR